VLSTSVWLHHHWDSPSTGTKSTSSSTLNRLPQARIKGSSQQETEEQGQIPTTTTRQTRVHPSKELHLERVVSKINQDPQLQVSVLETNCFLVKTNQREQ